MKRLILVICIFFFIATGMSERAYSDSVNMLYTNYSIQHTMNEVYDLYSPPTGTPADTMYGGPYIGTFSNSQSTDLSNDTGLPISASTSSTHGWVGANSSISLFSVQNYAWADSFVLPFSIPEGYADLGGPSTFGTLAITNVNASWGFHPTSSSLEVDLLFVQSMGPYWDGVGGTGLSAKLWDTTDGTTLISLNSPTGWGHYLNANYSNDYTFLVNPNHIYEFDVSATSYGIYDSEYVQQNVTASITSVPEPSTMLLLGYSLLGLVGLAKRFAK